TISANRIALPITIEQGDDSQGVNKWDYDVNVGVKHTSEDGSALSTIILPVRGRNCVVALDASRSLIGIQEVKGIDIAGKGGVAQKIPPGTLRAGVQMRVQVRSKDDQVYIVIIVNDQVFGEFDGKIADLDADAWSLPN